MNVFKFGIIFYLDFPTEINDYFSYFYPFSTINNSALGLNLTKIFSKIPMKCYCFVQGKDIDV